MPGAAALLFRPGPALGADARRIALAVMEDAARRRGGRVLALADGAVRLEAPRPVLDGARDLLAAVLRGRDAALSDEAAPDDTPADAPEDRLAARPLESLLRRDAVWGFAPDGTPHPLATRVMPDDAALRAALGPARAGDPWLAHARDGVAARCLREPRPDHRRLGDLLDDPHPGGPVPGPLHLLVPEGPLPPLPPDILPLLPPRALAAPPSRPFGLVGLAPDAFALLGAIPAAVVCAYLVPPIPEAALALLGPRRIILDAPGLDPAAVARLGVLGLVRGAAAP